MSKNNVSISAINNFLPVKIVSSNYTMVNKDSFIIVNTANITITLPNANIVFQSNDIGTLNTTCVKTIKNNSNGNITLSTGNGNTIEGGITFVLQSGESVSLIAINSNDFVII